MLLIETLPRPAELLPHRPPMLLIDEIQTYIPGESVTATTFVHPDMPFFEGHFPGEPILPGVILIEMMFQACGLYGRLEALSAYQATGATDEPYRPKSGRAIKVDDLSFSKAVLPNDRLQIRAEFSHKLFHFSVFKARVDIIRGASTLGAAAKGTVTVLINP